jgi:NAD(P)-dependent dehydrogenase (short-subunit alcohol dehydrogenase family)
MGIMEKMRLDGKSALVTGGARGSGKSVATAFCEAGADVVIVDVDLAEAEKTAAELAGATGRRVIAFRADVTSPDDAAAMVAAAVEAFGKLDIAMCNAGICKNIPAADMTLAEWKQVIDINLTGVFLTAQAAGRQMMKQETGGSIINTASMSGHIVNVPQPQCSYNASKAGVIQLTKSLAIEWADKKIRVNSLSPGYIGTELVLASETLKPLISQWNAMAPLHRLGSPDELQAICVYLAGDAASFTTGADFVVDGAFTAI